MKKTVKGQIQVPLIEFPVNGESKQYKELSGKGEYSVKFLLLVAKLLMVQEKSNREDAYMFGKVLKSLKDGKDIFGIISAATHR